MDMRLPEVPKGAPRCALTVLNAGNYRTMENFINRNNPMRQMWGPALFFLIDHPERGKFLFDTGYDTRYYEATRKFPYSILKLLVPAKVEERENVRNQLAAMGIAPKDVTVVLSHLHIDHAAGIHDFPDSQIYISKEEWAFTRKSALRLLADCYLKSLFDQIDPNHVTQVDFCQGRPYGPFERSADILGDGSLVLVPLFGHTAGQMGMLVNCAPEERYFLIADAVYTRSNYEDMVRGASVSNIAHTVPKDYYGHFQFLHDLHQANPELQIMPAHDPAVYEQYVRQR